MMHMAVFIAVNLIKAYSVYRTAPVSERTSNIAGQINRCNFVCTYVWLFVIFRIPYAAGKIQTQLKSAVALPSESISLNHCVVI